MRFQNLGQGDDRHSKNGGNVGCDQCVWSFHFIRVMFSLSDLQN